MSTTILNESPLTSVGDSLTSFSFTFYVFHNILRFSLLLISPARRVRSFCSSRISLKSRLLPESTDSQIHSCNGHVIQTLKWSIIPENCKNLCQSSCSHLVKKFVLFLFSHSLTLTEIALRNSLPSVTTPPIEVVGSLLYYHRLEKRGGQPVGGQTIEDLTIYTAQIMLKANTPRIVEGEYSQQHLWEEVHPLNRSLNFDSGSEMMIICRDDDACAWMLWTLKECFFPLFLVVFIHNNTSI